MSDAHAALLTGSRSTAGHDARATFVRHDFLGERHDHHARRTTAVLIVCALTMIVELLTGALFGSMALIADGLHMATHAGVMFVAALAYRVARRRLNDPSFSFGTGKIGDLAAFASAVALASTAGFIAVESLERMLSPVPIAFDEALVVAVIGLAVNLLSVLMLHDSGHAHDHGHDDHATDRHNAVHHRHADHGQSSSHHDHNLRAAYLHVLADAGVSILAIIALLLGRQRGWSWLDPAMGLVGAFVIARWSLSLSRFTASVLLDRIPDQQMLDRIRGILEKAGAKIVDLHLWRVGPGHNAVIASVSGLSVADAARCGAQLRALHMLSHVTVECLPPDGSDHHALDVSIPTAKQPLHRCDC